MGRKHKPTAEEPAEEVSGPTPDQMLQQAHKGQPGAAKPEPQADRKCKEPYTGEIRVLPDGTKAHLRHYTNRRGTETLFEFEDKDRRPPPEVVEPFKEEHQGRECEYYVENPDGERVWHKRVAGRGKGGRRLDPLEERTDAEERFESAVERLKATLSNDGREEGRSV